MLDFSYCRYIATIDGDVNKRQLVAMSEGADIDGVLCVPESVELLPPQPDISRPRVRIVVYLMIEECKYPLRL